MLGSAAVDRPAYLGDPTVVAVGGGIRVLIDGDAAYVADDTSGVDRLQAYDLRSGRRRWVHGIDSYSGDVRMAVVGGAVLVSSQDRSRFGVAAFDPMSGAALWDVDQPLAAVTATGRPILAGGDPAGRGWVLAEVDPRSGAPVWSVPVGRDCRWVFGHPFEPAALISRQVTALVVVCRAGGGAPAFTLTAIDLRTGRPAATATVPAPGSSGLPDVTVVDGLVLVKDNTRPHQPTIAFRQTDLSRAWSGSDTANGVFIMVCQDRICRFDGNRTSLLDPATGRPAGTPDPAPVPGTSGYFLIPAGIHGAVGLDEIKSADVMFGPPVASSGPSWLAVTTGSGWRIVRPLPTVGPNSCLIAGGALVCATGDNVNVLTNQLVIWRLPR
jgi:hypothetical protein